MSKFNLVKSVKSKFNELFNSKPILVNAPGRINLIGEHTDYNNGFVLPAAIDKSIVFAIAENDDAIFRFFSLDFEEWFSSKEISKNCDNKSWVLYLMGVLAQFEREGIMLKGIDCVFGGNIPLGAGLSSSAALECGFAVGLNKILKTSFSNYQLVKMSQKAEHEYAEVMCGIMDQFASVFGKQDHVFRLDCQSHKHEYFPLSMENHLIALVNTNVKHKLASTQYNQRRLECEEGVRILRQFNANINSLRDVDLAFIEIHKDDFDSVIYKRCHYVVSENQRVLNACNALENNKFADFGKLMYQSHHGLKNEYEVSCRELDILVDISKSMDYVLGARMMGGGFGGCTINLINSEYRDEFQTKIANEYHRQMNIHPEIYFVKLSDGVGFVD
jgi:galactokinase